MGVLDTIESLINKLRGMGESQKEQEQFDKLELKIDEALANQLADDKLRMEDRAKAKQLKLEYNEIKKGARKRGKIYIPHKFKQMNKGGMMDNQTVKAFATGGEAQIDPVSGNEVPEGSFPNEVRDDVPAMLSEGEYVVPADVLRFYGLKFFEDLRENAKIEIARMSQEGRIGGEPVEEPESLSDKDVIVLERMVRNANNGSKGDVVEMAKGGLIDKFANTIKMNPGGLVSSNLYSDPTKVDAIIKEVSIAAKDNPELFKRLASKGVVLDKTNANMKPEEMLEKNKPMFNLETGKEIVKANEGTFISPNSNLFYYPGMFKPEERTTSTGTFKDAQGNTITVRYETINGVKMMTGYTRDDDPDKRLFPIPIPAGFSRVETDTGTELDNLELAQPDKELPDSADTDGDGIPDSSDIKGFNERTATEQQEYAVNAQKMIDYKGPYAFVINRLGKFNLDYYDKQMKSKIGKSRIATIGGKKTYTAGISRAAQSANDAALATKDKLGGFKGKERPSGSGSSVNEIDRGGDYSGPGPGQTSGAEDYAGAQYGGFGEITGLNKGGLANKKSKPIKKKMNTGGLVQKKKKKNSK